MKILNAMENTKNIRNLIFHAQIKERICTLWQPGPQYDLEGLNFGVCFEDSFSDFTKHSQ